MKVEASTIEELIENSPRSAELAEIDALIAEAVPQLPRRLFAKPSITMIGYGDITPTGTPPDEAWPLIAVAPQKQHISVYISTGVGGDTIIARFRDRLGRVSLGKHCVRFTRFDLLDQQGWREFIRASAVAADSLPL